MMIALRRLGGRFLVMLSGEVLQSAFAFCLNIILARTLPAERYGLFAIVVLIGGFGLMYMRALIGVPACTYIPQSRRVAVARFYAVMFGSGALAVSIAGAILVTTILAFWTNFTAIAAGLFVGSWSLRSYIRMALFAQGRAVLATVGDVIFTASATLLCAPVLWHGATSNLLPQIFLVLTLAHLIGIGFALAALRQPIRLSLRRTLRRRLIRLLPTMTWSIFSVTMVNIQGQGAVLFLALFAGPAAYAPIAATMAFFSPLRIAAMALANMTQPDLAAELSRPHSRGLMDMMLASIGMMVGVCACYGIGMVLIFPTLSAQAFGHRFGDAPLDLIAVNIWFISSISTIYSVPRVLLEAARQFAPITAIAAGACFISFPSVALLLHIAAPAWALIGIILSELSILVGSWVLVLNLLQQRSGRVPASVRPTGLQPRASGREIDAASTESGVDL